MFTLFLSDGGVHKCRGAWGKTFLFSPLSMGPIFFFIQYKAKIFPKTKCGCDM